MLSSEALSVGRSLGVNSNIEKFTFDSEVRGYHVCKDVWKPAIGKILHAQQEPDNAAYVCPVLQGEGKGAQTRGGVLDRSQGHGTGQGWLIWRARFGAECAP